MNNLTTAFFEIVKADKNDDGTLMVYGKATDDSLDIDQQICDPIWLDTAMPEWFKSGGNIREQHSSIAAGVAKEYEKKADGHYIHALVVDPISVKKVDTGVLKGFSIGIKSPRVIRDTKAANGRIVDGQIVEVSLVDRPANPNCQLVLAKSVEGESGMWKVEQLIEKEEKKPNYAAINSGGGKSEPADKELYNRVKNEAKAKFDVYPSAVANAWTVREYKKRGGTYKKKTEKSADGDLMESGQMNTAIELVETAKSLALGDIKKFDQKLYDSARTALAQLIVVEANEMATEDSNEEMSIAHLLAAVHHLFAWYEGEKAEGEVMDTNENIEMAADSDKEMMCKECNKVEKECKCAGGFMKSAQTHKCLECGCGIPQDTHGRDDVTTAEMVSPDESPKSAEAEEVELPIETPAETPVEEATPTEEVAPVEAVAEETVEAPAVEEEKVSESDELTEKIEALVDKALKNATESLKSEIANLTAAKEAAVEKAVGLESELLTAKSLAVGGGPKRTVKPIDHASTDLLVKAATYKAKADATTDPDLAKGYGLMAKEYFAKAAEAESN